MKPGTAVGTVVFAERNGKIYALSVQRANTRKWNGQVIFGAAEKPEGKEKARETLFRGLKEELLLPEGKVLGIKPIVSYKPASDKENLGLTARFYSVRVSFETLQSIVQQINQNPEKFYELRNARINRISTLGKKPQIVQPHCRESLPRIKDHLRRRKSK